MAAAAAICAFLAAWLAALLLHRLAIRKLHPGSGSSSSCQVSPFFARLHTAALNGAFLRLGRLRWLPWRLWYDVGVVVSLGLMAASCVLLTVVARNTLAQRPASEQVLTPVVPGVNLPGSQLPYYLGALLLCGVFHELGHALAAVREDVRVHAAGVFLLGVYPGAFVDLSTDDLALVSPGRRLRVFCAGVWHNTAMALTAALLLTRPAWLLAPLGYGSPGGAVVTWLAQGSVLAGEQGLYPGDAIVRLNQCPVPGPAEYYGCVAGIFAAEPQGYCLSRGLLTVPASASAASSCCHGNLSDSHLCFRDAGGGSGAACLPARGVTERPVCDRPTDCPAATATAAADADSSTSVCARPAVDNASRLVRLAHDPALPAVLFLGEAPDLLYGLALSEFRPPAMLPLPLWLPAALDTGLRYVVSLSGALALLNAVPCYALDGQWILAALLDLAVANCRVRQAAYRVGLAAGTSLLVLNVLLALRYLYAYHV